MIQMAVTCTPIQTLLRRGVHALQRVANYVLAAALDQRLQKLGESKELRIFYLFRMSF